MSLLKRDMDSLNPYYLEEMKSECYHNNHEYNQINED